MLLRELLACTNENTKINVMLNDELVTNYDGKNSIDTIYNDYSVSNITCEDNTLIIEIY